MTNEKILTNISHIGSLLLKCGSEIYRVEESLLRMAKAYSFEVIDVFAIPSYLTISASKDDNHYFFSKRSNDNFIHLDNLILLNELVREISSTAPDINYVEQRIKEIENKKSNQFLILLGYILTASFFTLFYGGRLDEMLLAGIIGLSIYTTTNILKKASVNKLFITLVSSMQLAILALSAEKLMLTGNVDSLIIGSLMVLVPGVAITNSLRDLIGGEFVSGLARITEAILVALAIATGVAVILVAF